MISDSFMSFFLSFTSLRFSSSIRSMSRSFLFANLSKICNPVVPSFPSIYTLTDIFLSFFSFILVILEDYFRVSASAALGTVFLLVEHSVCSPFVSAFVTAVYSVNRRRTVNALYHLFLRTVLTLTTLCSAVTAEAVFFSESFAAVAAVAFIKFFAEPKKLFQGKFLLFAILIIRIHKVLSLNTRSEP